MELYSYTFMARDMPRCVSKVYHVIAADATGRAWMLARLPNPEFPHHPSLHRNPSRAHSVLLLHSRLQHGARYEDAVARDFQEAEIKTRKQGRYSRTQRRRGFDSGG